MSYCITGVAPPPPKAGLVLVRTLRPDTVLYAGIRCHDGRPITASRLYQEALRLGCSIRRAKPTAPTAPTTQRALAEPLTTFAAPTVLAHILGHKTEIATLQEWLAAWPNKGRAVLIAGPPGIGKTTTAHLLAKDKHYHVTEWNASDARSVQSLQSLHLTDTRIRRELLIMDEVDGLAEKGGCAELAAMIPRAALPVICITNTLPPKLAALQKVTLLVKFSRPMKSSIAQWLQGAAKAAHLPIPSKAELEAACEANGNDIRAILNAMDFQSRRSGDQSRQSGDQSRKSGDQSSDTLSVQKDAQLDLFAATTRLMSRSQSWQAMEDLVYVDHGMVPLMVHEAAPAASRSIEEVTDATEEISWGDQVHQRLWKTQDWSLLPLTIASTISAARKRTGKIPFQIFPRVLGKMSTANKHRRQMADAGRARHSAFRLEEAEWIQKIIAHALQDGTKASIEHVIRRLEAMGLTRDHLGDMGEVLFTPVEISTKTKTALTREYNKQHGADIRAKKGSTLQDAVKEDADDEEQDEQQEED